MFVSQVQGISFGRINVDIEKDPSKKILIKNNENVSCHLGAHKMGNAS